MRMKLLTAALAGAALFTAVPSYAVTEIQWWHAMTGALGDQVNLIADDFNASQSDYKVVPVYKGGYADTMAAGIAAYRAGNAPDILQVFEVGTATMMAAKGAVLPVYKLMEQTGNKLDMSAYMPAVASYYSDTHGRLISMPFNSSTPVFFYNKDAFKKAGLDPANPPKTWDEVGEDAAKIKSSGAAPCAFTTGWEVWVQMETMSAWDNVQFATLENGFGGLGAKLTFNNPTIVRHIAELGKWAKDGRFTYAGRTTQPEAKFYAGDCAMLTSSSAARANIVKNAKFDVGMSYLPYDAFAKGAPQNTIIGGASLWTFTGRSKDREKATAAFFEFMSSPKIQARWHQNTGYVPITKGAYELTKQDGYYDKNPGTDIAVKQLLDRNPTKVSKGVRLGYLPQIRDVTDEELEAVWTGKKSAKAALDEAVKRGDVLLRKFQRENR
ncbi:MAG TPA: sn-glycerol-3-phosphate ABC transporter substrate-binding protein UgpB [Burkholderiales bacterium]|nr:sn-glycerol-3-phosphate ABC transporter substrate-binding protein UgpB [Burkholderiales bacterium]